MADEQTTRVTLRKRHTHKGVDYQPGDEIEVTESEKKWLSDEKRQIIEGSSQRNATTVSENATGAGVERTGSAPGMQGPATAVRHSNPRAAK